MNHSTMKLQSMIAPGEPAVQVLPSHHLNVSLHDHDFYELVYVTEGYCLNNVGGLSTLLMEGDCIILPPGVVHTYSGNRVTRIYNCVFDAAALGPHLEQLRQLAGLNSLFGAGEVLRLRLSLSERKMFLKWIASMAELRSSKPLGWEVQLPSELACLLVEYARACASRSDASAGEDPYPAYVWKAMSVIDGNYHDCDLSVHRIASLVGCSDDHLTRQFKQVTGISTQEYLRRYRFARAMSLLQTGDSIAQVAKLSGFRTLSYFSREFTKELGITPSNYRNQTNQK